MELIRALALLAEPSSTEHTRVAELLGLGEVPEPSAYTDLFLLQLYPYAAVYLSGDGMMGGVPADRIAGFWGALGHVPPPEPDHLSALLSLFASLEDAKKNEDATASGALLANASDTLLCEHLLPWVPSYLHAVQRLGGTFHRAWAELLSQTLQDAWKQVVSPTDRQPSSLSATDSHLPCVPSLNDPRESGGEAFLKGLLAPAACGIILTRADFSRAAGTLGLGSRIGERSYQLKALLSQEAQGVMGWIHAEATRWVDWHETAHWGPPHARDHWLARSRHTRNLLESLLEDGWDAGPTA